MKFLLYGTISTVVQSDVLIMHEENLDNHAFDMHSTIRASRLEVIEIAIAL